MNKKRVFWLSLATIVVSYVLINPLKFGFCNSTYTFGESVGCVDKLLPTIGLVTGLFSVIVFTLSILTYLLREEVFRAWLRFAYWWVPLSVVVIYLSAGSSGGGFGIPNVFDQETVAIIFSGLFAFISLVLILIKSLLLRNK